MKRVLLISVIAIAVITFFMREKIQDAFFGSDLPEPTSIAFEKQVPIFSYNWRLIGSKGTVMSFVEYMNRNVIVNYWSPNSKESVEELKQWAKLYDDYKNDIYFIFVTKDSQQDVNKFLKEKGYVFPVFYSGSTPLKTIVLEKAPRTYLITKSGRVTVDHSGVANWNSENFRKLLDDIIKQNK
ncbi:hypothetical protein ABGT15_01930 [Flavobacterium enshiense]|uniref:TlpA family protein disulfide reductase n=1 Tax=Flavobacterium enshiense TaxID=1341165 RepID=UPI00345DEDB2